MKIQQADTSAKDCAAACFDLFNTLVSVGRVPDSIGPYTADILGIDHAQWRRACFGPLHQISAPTEAFENLRCLAHSIDPTIPRSRIEQAVSVRQARFDHALIHVEAEVLAGLEQLRAKGVRLGLVSNASTSEISAWARSPLAEFFQATVFSCEAGCRKPEAQIYQQALSALEVTPQACLFVGDGGSDEHRGAASVGMQPILLTQYIDSKESEKLRSANAAVLVGEAASVLELSAWFEA